MLGTNGARVLPRCSGGNPGSSQRLPSSKGEWCAHLREKCKDSYKPQNKCKDSYKPQDKCKDSYKPKDDYEQANIILSENVRERGRKGGDFISRV